MFKEWMEACNLTDLEFNGTRFTWRGPVWEDGCRIFKCLDRALCNVNWNKRFQDVVVKILPRFCSNHHPLLIRCEGKNRNQGAKLLRFEYM
ncbi:hypothetical protein AHAS_Ahas05G0050700 [Arachis hypogaea]